MSDLDRVLNGPTARRSLPPHTQGGAQQGTIVSVGESTARVVIDSFSRAHYFELSYGRSTSPPQAGDKCLVVFTPGSRDTGWLVAWNVDS